MAQNNVNRLAAVASVHVIFIHALHLEELEGHLSPVDFLFFATFTVTVLAPVNLIYHPV